MKKLSNILVITLGLIVLTTILYLSPSIDVLLSKVPFIKDYYQNTALTVTTKRGRADVFVNGVDYGETPVTITNLEEGKHLVELRKFSDTTDLYQKQQFYVNLYRRTESIIDMEIAPDNFKSGYILYYTPTPNKTGGIGHLTVQSTLNDYEVLIGDESFKKGEVVSYSLKTDEYDLKIQSKGHESVEFPVIIREGYNLNATIYLLPIPINLN